MYLLLKYLDVKLILGRLAQPSAAGGKYLREIERVRMSHRHNQEAQIISLATGERNFQVRNGLNPAKLLANDVRFLKPNKPDSFRCFVPS